MGEPTTDELLDALIHRVRWGKDETDARAAVAARMSPGWQPIETAPRDGTRVLLFIPAYTRGEPVRLGAYAEGERWWRTTSGPCSDDALPTLWQSLPTPPSQES